MKSSFKSGPIRGLSDDEKIIKGHINNVIKGLQFEIAIGTIPEFGSSDNKKRPLILNSEIAGKIIRDHGEFHTENFVINAMDWDFIIRNVDGNPDKINLIKKIGNQESYLTIGANRHNGFYVVTHYEKQTKRVQKLKNLLRNKGDALDRSGRAAYPSFATSSS